MKRLALIFASVLCLGCSAVPDLPPIEAGARALHLRTLELPFELGGCGPVRDFSPRGDAERVSSWLKLQLQQLLLQQQQQQQAFQKALEEAKRKSPPPPAPPPPDPEDPGIYLKGIRQDQTPTKI